MAFNASPGTENSSTWKTIRRPASTCNAVSPSRVTSVDVAGDGDSGLERALSGAYDLLILDVMLPRRDGFEILRELRRTHINTPALFLSARGDASDRIAGLNLGADDYLPKPFAFEELVARIRAVERRATAEPDDGRFAVADLELDLVRHSVQRAGKTIQLTLKEFKLLELLMRHEGEALSRPMMTEKVWGYEFQSYSNLIDVHITHLRKKVDHDYPIKLIHTVTGVGYVMEARSAEEEPPRAND